MKIWAAFLFFLFSTPVFAQRLSGIVVDRATKKPVAFATLATAYITAYTSDDGRFSMANIHSGDTIRVNSMGYKTYKFAFDAKAGDTITINLQQVSILLRDVAIRAQHDRKLDSIRTRKEFEATFAYIHPGIKDAFITKNPYAYVPYNYIDAPNSTAEIVSVNLLSVIQLLSKNKDPQAKLHQTLLKDEESNYADRMFSKQKVTAITGLRGDSLQDFMSSYRPSVPALKKMSDYELMTYIKKSYTEFMGSYKKGTASLLAK